MLKQVSRGSYGRLIQIFLACKYYGDRIPRIGSGRAGIEVRDIQYALDELYEKPSRLPEESILSLFNDNHLFHTDRPSNNWRNNFNLQKGFSCFGSEAEMQDIAFLTTERIQCPHVLLAEKGALHDAKCALGGDATYRKEVHPKVFRIGRIDADTSYLWVVDPSNLEYYRPIILHPRGRRLPIIPIICAIYFDSRLAAGRVEVDTHDFALDFNFSAAEYAAYFDDDPENEAHRTLVSAFPELTWNRHARATVPMTTTPHAPTRRTRPRPPPTAPEDLPLIAPPIAPPAGSHWWDAEQAVRKALEDNGWTVIDRTRQGVGFDFQAMKNGLTRYIEVKSSAGPCAPTLTENEYQQASRLGWYYVLAVVENFHPTRAVKILWVPNPVQVNPSARTVAVYPLSRASWLPHAKADFDF